MRFTKFFKMLFAIIHHLMNYPTPPNLSYAWSLGGLLLVAMLVQMVSGIFLSMHYSPDTSIAFYSVEQHIMRDVTGGWFVRYLHSNGASFIFGLMYLHIGRALYYKAYNPPRHVLWMSGVGIFFLTMAAAFLGYVLPWGQMSFWGATVITNLFSAIPIVGYSLAIWIWGGFSVGNPTLVRFFTLHFGIPFLILSIIVLHISLLHEDGSTNTNNEAQAEEVEFGNYFFIKDAMVYTVFLIVFITFLGYLPNILGHTDNAIPADPVTTPLHIVPEWYFLPFYAILKSVPSKRLGVFMMAGSIFYLFIYADCERDPKNLLTKGTISSYWYRSIFWLIVFNFFLLGWIGAMPAEETYVKIGVLSTQAHFLLMLTYSFFFPKTIFDFLNSLRVFIFNQVSSYIKKMQK